MFHARNVSVRYGGHLALQAATLAVEPGAVTVLIGPNGAGKSTLLKALCGDLVPGEGSVEVDGRNILLFSAAELAARRAVLSQATQLSFPFTVHEVVRLGLESAGGVGAAERRRMIDAALHRVELTGFGGRFYQELSGGEQQRVQLARVLCQIGAPATAAGRTLFLDEPTSSLDLRHQLVVLKLAREFAAAGGAVLAILHDLNLAAGFADRIAVVGTGRLVALGTPAEVLTDRVMEEVFSVPLRMGVVPPLGIPFVLPQSAPGIERRPH